MSINNSNSINKALLKESIFIIGTVSSVEGRKVKIEVKKDKNLSHISYNGKTIKNVAVGSYVKIAKGFTEIIGKVEGEYITKEKIYNKEYKKEELKILRFLEVVLFGNFEKGYFKQGIKEMPLIDNECYLLDKNEFNKLHQFYNEKEKTILLGFLTEESSQPIRLSIRKLFASHIGIFGNTGSGKSNTLAKIYTELFLQSKESINFNRKAHFVLIDFNGEYVRPNLITTDKNIYNLSTRSVEGDKFYIKQGNIETLEIISVLLEATEKTQKPFLSRAIKNNFYEDNFDERSRENINKLLKDILQKADPNLQVNIFSEIFEHLKKIELPNQEYGYITERILSKIEGGELKYHSDSKTYYVGNIYSNANLQGVFDTIFPNIDQVKIDPSKFGKIKFKILSQYFFEVTNGYSIQEHIRPLIGRMIKKFNTLERLITIDPNEKKEYKNLEVINLSNANLEMKKTLPLIISKQLYDEHKEVGEFEDKSLHIIIDEAHNILSSTSERESETWKDYRLETFEEIIKEGRKFSTFLTISSQRPYDISPTIISQLHNYFIHRLINNNDINAIQKTVAYLDKLSFESIPLLPVGSCFVAGQSSDIPVKVEVILLDENKQPKSETIDLDKAWFDS
ncbi:ATP-binding protein [uncultured Algibacter sp.]|uniref:ATP-binding protein n=1 Tax=uncultured Algibacter sp. TaxID=298659 RepID=UPI002630DF0C|nr:ATP-binding protein [uncultured Algibacter sp.]